MSQHPLTRFDRILVEIERALGTTLDPQPSSARPSPSAGIDEAELDEVARRHAGGLMRVNHVGEVCAQALYSGQAAVARDPRLREQLLEAAAEETDHLAWCGERLQELGDRTSLLNPLWYGGAYTIGALAGLASDRLSLGFVVETERQVEAHLDGHLSKLPASDQRSRAIVVQMKQDEARHAEQAMAAGGADLPTPVKHLMRVAANLMRAVAYRL
ncbi:MAG TPA: 2-polyprenyl-3-methyl-6-methoxy-1,4-benzoquinone monooxygenase [Dokdonella sp.]|uniref:2-polyprenyl-3-methyl-6-methoxy-1,4-benzoquinone monooxygenase n=1 Tax=Dokdonella sp. TaxID=2291710 RepID=UPI002B971897|nr:2-polyprenyl-3-methyl-6-methoxy-1,4-benzoquinone monooxygenase [Dokdonella sp.]HOX71830.1 2-polyprenyl-3-methyl-6-methoxy-1,4-benzoquinone monooxygenase [Dokdonella sp.]HPG93533.1 2-polyprenyl-3-methyl-6-methoxy-1,4-benzoquinone monooxygenase [Dokdonella sp.]HPN79767.1 2-polyprenyl-3-methyl-6-methoxy-1,4-benzoquinone monooxygenase [Dokdonella sp.]